MVDLTFDTPMIYIPSLSRLTGCQIFGKAEFMSITGSSKGRVAVAIVNAAEKNGFIAPHQECALYEGTVGSTGIALAMIARAKGYKCYIVMPDDQAKEKYQILEALGATIEKVRPCSIIDANHYVNIARQRAEEQNSKAMPGSLRKRALFCDQFENEANYQIHYQTTGPEIYEQMDGKLDAFVMGAGTGGTLSGVSLYLKEKNPNIQIVLADPFGSGLHNKVLHGIMFAETEIEGTRKRHQVDTVVEGIGINRLTKNFEKSYQSGHISHSISVSDAEATEMSRYIMQEDGLFLGSSSAVNLVAARKVAQEMGPGKVIVTVLCDSGTRHLTKFWNQEYMASVGLMQRRHSSEYQSLESLE